MTRALCSGELSLSFLRDSGRVARPTILRIPHPAGFACADSRTFRPPVTFVTSFVPKSLTFSHLCA
jgi:hypothetical protein